MPLINEILQTAKIATHSCFISYAWENGEDNVKLQTWLSDLKEDLEMVGIKTFLDIDNMHGKMKPRMEENIEQSGFVLLIGTPKFKERVEQDRLYKMSRMIFDIRMGLNSDATIRLSKEEFKSKGIVLIENEDTVYFIEDGK
ncbi:MAG: toll/interleukin-1 receptor domain-containing protein, partial [Gammaproteobacteria bacterium]